VGWYIIAAELVLGGAGGYFAIEGISLRTLLLIASMGIFCIQQRNKIPTLFTTHRSFVIVLGLLYFAVALADIRGYVFGHSLSLIISDTIPYLFFLYYFPLQELIKSEEFKANILTMLYAAFLGNFLLIVFTFVGFSSHVFNLQDNYYHWYRDVALGKITDAGANFFRIVINEHLLLIPLFLVFFYQKIQTHTTSLKQNLILWVPFLSLIILTSNLTRIYMIAMAIGILLLLRKTTWKKWLFYACASGAIFMISFISTNLLLSQGKSFGLELLGLRIHSITRPNIEDSALSRVLLLPKIEEKIKQHPILGDGLGDTVTVYSPVFKKDITTPHFDWGYLELLTELGLLGFVVWAVLIYFCIKSLFKLLPEKRVPLLASLIALLIINLTSPALFHVLGIIWIVVLITIVSNNETTAEIHAS
jgi:O-antigen ligase